MFVVRCLPRSTVVPQIISRRTHCADVTTIKRKDVKDLGIFQITIRIDL